MTECSLPLQVLHTTPGIEVPSFTLQALRENAADKGITDQAPQTSRHC